MFPLYEAMFVPSLFVTPLVMLVAYVWRSKSETYAWFWWTAVVICFLLTIFYTILVLSTPLYSQQDHSPDNPGGFGRGATLPAVLGYLFFAFCIVLPSFPTLLGLPFLTPRNLRIGGRSALTVLIVLYVAVAYMADYVQERTKPRQSPFERFEHLRDSPPSIRQQQQQQRLRQRIEQRQKQEGQRQQPLASKLSSKALVAVNASKSRCGKFSRE